MVSRGHPYVILIAITCLWIGKTLAETDDALYARAFEFIESCGDKDLAYCMKERAVRFIENVSGDYEITEGITLVRTGDATPENSRSLPQESIDTLPVGEREQAIDNLLIDRVAKFLGSHTVQFKFPESTIGEMKRSLEESRKKKKKFLIPILLLLKLKAATLIPVVLGSLALLAFKALIIGKIALIIAGVIAVKQLLANKHTSQTYEVVAHPHHTYSSSYSDDHGHYKRSFSESNSPQNIAYSAHTPNKS